MKVRIVLVEPLEAGNVGAAARAMKNFGFTDLWLTGEREPRNDTVSAWWAVGALDVVDQATRVATLDEALVDCQLTVATTAIRARQVHDPITPETVATLAHETLGEEHRVAIVFGREKSGLTGAEVMLCQRTAYIPTSPAYPTMNLAQSVGVFCYELGKKAYERASSVEPAPHQLLAELRGQMQELLTTIDFSADKNPIRHCAELQALAGRAGLSMREASLLLSLVRKARTRIAGE